MTNNNTPRYAVIDVKANGPIRVIGEAGIYITSAAQMREHGFAKREEAEQLCASLNSGEVEYETGKYIVGTFRPFAV